MNPNPATLRAQNLARRIANLHEVPWDEVVGLFRHKKVILVRALIANILRDHPQTYSGHLSLPEIAAIFGRESHSAVIEPCNRLKQARAAATPTPTQTELMEAMDYTLMVLARPDQEPLSDLPPPLSPETVRAKLDAIKLAEDTIALLKAVAGYENARTCERTEQMLWATKILCRWERAVG